MKANLKIVGILLTLLGTASAHLLAHRVEPDAGYVPNAETAVRIALAVWEPIYGKKQIESEKPYHAKLQGGVWIVEGSLPEGWRGGVAIAEISAENAMVLRVSHGK